MQYRGWTAVSDVGYLKHQMANVTCMQQCVNDEVTDK